MIKNIFIKNNKGQLGVFVGMSLLVIISLLAFVINVGLFVKAKINLQNAIDAAAYAGAATQARRLTNIGHLNYEIRNIMKEWMFKYYIIGNLGNSKVRDNAVGSPLDFRPKSFQATAEFNSEAFSKFNIPRICINFGSQHNICNVYGVPGVPRFPSTGSVGLAKMTDQFANQAVSIKSKNCADRSVLNFSTTLLWTYGKGGPNSGFQDAPQLLAHRPGAWPQAFEYGLRMRNLEYIVNRPPVEQGICMSSGSNCIALDELISAGGNTPLNERPIAAFQTAFRNLGGGSDTINGGADHLNMKSTLKLTELAPNPLSFTAGEGLSGFLIPGGHSYPGAGIEYSKKYYLDLKIVPNNYVIFFTTFVADNEKFSADITSEGACSSSITGIPVPFYITGFIKNPEVLTYYAVKGEAKYVGLFYPFNLNEGITMRAYAAAKPMGGKIGPILFKVDGDQIFPRDDDITRSRGFLMALDMSTTGGWKAGLPIPFDEDSTFYLKNSTDLIGGNPVDGSIVPKFSLPNLVFDYIPGSSSLSGSAPLNTIKFQADGSAAETLPGLYDSQQYHSLRSSTPSSGLSSEILEGKVIQARRATKFDALNFLVPTHNNKEINAENPGIVRGPISNTAGVRYTKYNLYAPLCDDSSIMLYNCTSGAALENLIKNFIKNAGVGLNQYLKELHGISEGLRNQTTSTGGGSNYVAAADTLADKNLREVSSGDPSSIYTSGDTTCNASAPLADKFWIFFSTAQDNPLCGVTPLHRSTKEFFEAQAAQFRDFIQPEYYLSGGGTDLPENLYGGFRPTPRDGAGQNGEVIHPFQGAVEASGKRNFYSTKLISIKKVLSNTDPNSFSDLFSYAEQYSGGSLRSGTDQSIVGGNSTIRNILNPSDLDEFGDFKDAF